MKEATGESMLDVFLCHASEDKPKIVEPIARALDEAEITYWYDSAEIKWGDSVTAKINEGLSKSRYVLVVLSSSFIEKSWPRREFDSSLSREANTGEVRVLPLLVGDSSERDANWAKFPLLEDKTYIVWSGDPSAVVQALRRRLDDSTERVPFEESVKVELEIEQAPGPEGRTGHVGIMKARIFNTSQRDMLIHSIRLTTDGQWDLPLPGVVHSTLARIEDMLTGYLPTLKVLKDTGSSATYFIGDTLGASGYIEENIMLLTDHAPGYAMGLFLYLLRPTLVYDSEQREMQLPRFLVTLHGNIALSATKRSVSWTEFLPLQRAANKVLASIDDSVITAGYIKEELMKTVAQRPPSR